MPTPPNIVLITTDQQRGDCLSIDGHPVLQTPNLDAMATSGARFRRAATECPSCFPARRTLMSGQSPASHGMVGMSGWDWDPPHTLAGSLRDAGYQTHLVGKLHLQPTGKRFGFEHQELSNGPYEEDAYRRWLRETCGRHEVDPGTAHGIDLNGWVGRPNHLPEHQTHTFWCMNKALEFLSYQRDPTAPFFLNVSLFDPHPSMVPPEIYYDRYIHREMPDPVVGDWAEDPGQKAGYPTSSPRVHLPENQQRCMQAAYFGTCNFVDDQVGRLMLHLQRTGQLSNTLILFTSDHGEMLGDHHLFRKCWPYEGSTRVPFIIQPPHSWGLKGDPVVTDAPVGLQDVMPTLLDAAGVDIPDACTGRSLLPILRGEADSVRDALHIEDCGTYAPIDGYHALQSDRYKYIWYSQRETEHLFDLQEDPGETHDLALEADADAKLQPWRDKLADMIANRPEGFVEDGQLVRGKKHGHFVPGNEPDKFYDYA